ncbi:MAG: iron chaperone [Candidatus Nanopelagicus sp.]
MSKREIDQYIAKQSEPNKSNLKAMRAIILEIEPALKQGISYGIPAFKLDKDVVCGLAARKSGCSFYPFSGSVLAALRNDLVKYKQTKSALHFDAPLPKTLVRKLMTQRMVQIMVKKKRK